MKTVTVTRSRIVELSEIFDDASRVKVSDGESMSTIQRFIWRAGRNYKICTSLCKTFEQDIKRISAPTPELLKYFEEQAVILAKFQDKDDDGKPKTHEDGQPFISEDKHQAVKQALEELKAQHPEAMVFVAKRETLAQEFMDGSVVVDFFTVTMDEIPQGVSGVWRVEITEMIDGALPDGD